MSIGASNFQRSAIRYFDTTIKRQDRTVFVARSSAIRYFDTTIKQDKQRLNVNDCSAIRYFDTTIKRNRLAGGVVHVQLYVILIRLSNER